MFITYQLILLIDVFNLFMAGANDSCEALSFQHEGQESYTNFTAASSVDMLSRSSHSISSQV